MTANLVDRTRKPIMDALKEAGLKASDLDEALDALIALGFPLKEATAALEKVDPGLPVEERIKLALKN